MLLGKKEEVKSYLDEVGMFGQEWFLCICGMRSLPAMPWSGLGEVHYFLLSPLGHKRHRHLLASTAG